MGNFYSDLFTLAGLSVTLIGAGVTAKAVILKDDDAIETGMPRWAGEGKEEHMKLPMVQNLLRASRAAKWGLSMVAAGTFLQAVPVFIRVIQ